MNKNTITISTPAQSRGGRCFKTIFNPTANGHDIANAYLLMMVSRLIFPDQLNASRTDRAAFETTFKDRFTPLGMDAFHFTHIYYRHPGYKPPITMDEARRNEEEADRFALEIMRRIGVAPFGMTFFFTALAHLDRNRWDFHSEEEYQLYLAHSRTHPLTPARLEVLAHRLKEAAPHFARTEPDFGGALEGVHYAVGQIAKMAGFLADEGVQRGIRQVGRSSDPRLLAPRRP